MTAFAMALALALPVLPRMGDAAEPIVLQLSGPATFEFAGYYAALWQGYYRDAGLDVTIRPGELRGQAPIDPAREVAAGNAQFGIGTMQLVIRRAQGLPVLLVAPIFQQSGAAVYYRADSDFSSPAALVNARLGRLPASNILDIELTTALRAQGIDPAKTKSVTISADQIVPALADHQIDAAIGSAWIVPWQAHERGTVLKSFNPASYRVEYYGDSLFTLQRFAETAPSTVARFREASLKGWEYALRHPDDMIARLIADKPGEPAVADIAGFDRYQADVARRLSRYPEIPLGSSNTDRWTQLEAGMIGAGVLERSADLTNFVYSPPAETSRGNELRQLPEVVVVAGIGFAGLLAAWLGGRLWRLLPRLLQRLPRRSLERQTEPFADPLAGGAVPQPQPAAPALPPLTDLNDVLAPLERRIRQQLRGKIRCRFSLVAELWPCRSEGGPVAACVLELVGAAAAAMKADGTLIVGTRNFTFDENNIADYPGGRLGPFARITVRDSAPGLTETQFAHIFDATATVRPAVTRAVTVMEKFGGFVRVESAEEIGTAVHLYFPRLDTKAPTEAVPTAQVAE
jgi:ABC-type nitrate/sulfonate/bicarbonate transport system substrate-binding protein